MFVDINAYVGHWPFRKLVFNTLSGLDELAREYDITHMAVANVNGLFYKDANVANLELLRELEEYSGATKFVPFAIVNPTYPGWEKDAREMIEKGFCGFEIAPRYHKYSLAPEMLYDMYSPVHRAGAVMQLAEELGVPVRICASFENFRQRSDLDTPDNISGDELFALLSKYENVTALLTSFSLLAVVGKLGDLVKARKNIYFDTTQGGMLDRAICRLALSRVPQEQICFGSLSPFNYIETNLLRTQLSDLDGEMIKKNGAKALGLI